MRIIFFKRDSKWDEPIAPAFCAGASIFAHKAEIKPLNRETVQRDAEGANVAIFTGVSTYGILGEPIFESLREAGTRLIFLDKGHIGRGEFIRASIDQFKPLHYLMKMNCPPDRVQRLIDRGSLILTPMQAPGEGEHIIFAGASNKYNEIMGLGSATKYAETIISQLRRQSSRGIVYRPKPSWAGEATPIEGSFFSRPPRSLTQELKGAYCLITHGSNAGADALYAGVPAITLGEGISRPLSRTTLEELDDLYYPGEEERFQWVANVAYCQWSLSEFRSGEAWESISDQLKRY